MDEGAEEFKYSLIIRFSQESWQLIYESFVIIILNIFRLHLDSKSISFISSKKGGGDQKCKMFYFFRLLIFGWVLAQASFSPPFWNSLSPTIYGEKDKNFD